MKSVQLPHGVRVGYFQGLPPLEGLNLEMAFPNRLDQTIITLVVNEYSHDGEVLWRDVELAAPGRASDRYWANKDYLHREAVWSVCPRFDLVRWEKCDPNKGRMKQVYDACPGLGLPASSCSFGFYKTDEDQTGVVRPFLRKLVYELHGDDVIQFLAAAKAWRSRGENTGPLKRGER